jgi:hypothetical protein
VDALRQHLEAVVSASPLWDKRVCGLQVTDLREQTMELRCLVSSRNSSENFDLRCLVREEMIAYLRDNYPARCRTCASFKHCREYCGPADSVQSGLCLRERPTRTLVVRSITFPKPL